MVVAILGCGFGQPADFPVEVRNLIFQRGSQLVGSAPEFPQAFAERARNFRELLGSKKEKSNEQDEPDLGELSAEQD
jgi:hypothetical protein